MHVHALASVLAGRPRAHAEEALRQSLDPASADGASGASVRVQPCDPEVDGVQREEDGREPEGGDDRGSLLLPPVGHAGVEVDREDDPRDEGERLLGIPAPVATPGVLAPDGPADDPERPDREADHHEGPSIRYSPLATSVRVTSKSIFRRTAELNASR